MLGYDLAALRHAYERIGIYDPEAWATEQLRRVEAGEIDGVQAMAAVRAASTIRAMGRAERELGIG